MTITMEVWPLYQYLLATLSALAQWCIYWFCPHATALIASQVPKDKSGAALGTLSTGVANTATDGSFVGGFFIAEFWGIRNVFYW